MPHTTGPWEISHQSNTIKQVNGPVLFDLNGVRIGDAVLAAAAPDLLDALVEAWSLLPPRPIHDPVHCQYTKIKDAIDKAKGYMS